MFCFHKIFLTVSYLARKFLLGHYLINEFSLVAKEALTVPAADFDDMKENNCLGMADRQQQYTYQRRVTMGDSLVALYNCWILDMFIFM
ncbi:hypothetical protein M5K25_018225 [Dendrobium thyrsiflorum]|uniref:Uncharacterized protein n=1 Tax=Dendrobium thyrsiflorum TaxID=117978 RepID=A0ABD0UHX0_DENTH